jgi:AraC family transcriptional regulator
MLDALRTLGPGSFAGLFPRGEFRLHAMLASAGYDRRAGGTYDWHGAKRGDAPFVLLQHTLSGAGRLRYEKRIMEVRPGQTMLLKFPHDNRYWLPPDGAWEFFWLCLNGREVTRLWREVLDRHGPVVSLSPAAQDRLAGFCLAALRQQAATPARASALAYAASMVIAEELLPWAEAPVRADRPPSLERAISLCQADLVRSLDVGRMAQAAGYSRHHFSRMFSAHQGLSPARYVLRLRLEEAARQLRSDPAPIKIIARRSGFTDANYFGKVFRKHFGIGPRDFRRSGMYAETGTLGSHSPAFRSSSTRS